MRTCHLMEKCMAFFWRTSERRSSSRDSRKNYLLRNHLWGCQGDVPKKLNQYVSDGWMTESQAKRVSGYKFKDWARLSRSMLCLSGCDKSTGEKISLIRAMWEHNLNFMELIYSEDFTFQKRTGREKKSVRKNLAGISI